MQASAVDANPCATSEGCGSLTDALRKDMINSTDRAQYGYCEADSQAISGDGFGKCLSCVSAEATHSYISNCKPDKSPPTLLAFHLNVLDTHPPLHQSSLPLPSAANNVLLQAPSSASTRRSSQRTLSKQSTLPSSTPPTSQTPALPSQLLSSSASPSAASLYSFSLWGAVTCSTANVRIANVLQDGHFVARLVRARCQPERSWPMKRRSKRDSTRSWDRGCGRVRLRAVSLA